MPMRTPRPASCPTESGRVYRLVRTSAWSRDAGYVRSRWCELYKVTSHTDVTERMLHGADDDDTLRPHQGGD
jgi:hypothetical protein